MPLTTRPCSLRQRVVGESAVAVVVLSLFGLVAFSATLDHILYSLAEEDARGQAQELSGLLGSGRLTLTRVREEVGSHGSVIQVVDSAGHLAAQSNRAGPSVLLSNLIGDRTRATSGRAVIPPGSSQDWALVSEPATVGSRQMAVLVAAPLGAESDIVQRAMLWLGLAAAAVLAAMALLVHRSLRVALGPVRRITAEVDRIQHANATGRITVPETADEISRLAEVMNRMLSRLESADQVTRQFLSNASHELRSPLATMRAVVEGQPLDSDTEAGRRDRVILGEVLRMQRLVEDISTLARADDARLGLVESEVDLDDLVHREVLRLRAAGVGPQVRADIAPARVRGDDGRITQAIRNVTDNAVRHARGAVAIRLAADAGHAVLTVDNDGPAIPDADRERVFGRFVRLEDAREPLPHGPASGGSSLTSGGSGLGLTIARTLVEAHRGRLTAETTARGWCRFRFEIPLAAPVADPADGAGTPGAQPTR